MQVGTVEAELRERFGDDVVLAGDTAHYLADETETRGVHGHADAIVLPRDADEVAAVVAWCYERDVAIVPRGGGTGYAGGCVPVDGGVVVALEQLARVRSFDPPLWRMEVEAGVTTARVRETARGGGLLFPPDPGAAEQSQIGGNVATNAGGPHAFKYGVTGAWVTGIEAVVAPGELVRVGGAIRKDVAGYDLKSLLIGSEGTLGVITSVCVELTPAPEAAWPVMAFLDGTAAGCAAVEQVLANGLPVAALEFLDAETMRLAGRSFPAAVPDGAFAVIAEADGSRDEAARIRRELLELFADARAVHAPEEPRDIAALWRWRDGVSIAVAAARGGKASEDIVVPVDRLAEAIDETQAIGARHGLRACAWGHAGDGNLHSTFVIAPDEAPIAARASVDLFELATRLGGSISGEHGLGWVKRGQLERQWQPRALDLHDAVKRAFDPRGLLNPGKKTSRVRN
jgi:glycolate oxidase subunit GlcD